MYSKKTILILAIVLLLVCGCSIPFGDIEYLTGAGAVYGTAATPTITNYGTYYNNSNYYVVGISCSTSGADIYYTENGYTPTTSSYRYSLNYGSYKTSSGSSYYGILVYKGSTVQAMAAKSGYTDSSVATLTLTLTNSSTVSTPTITNCGIYNSDFNYYVVSISFNSPGDSIYYTTNGNTPTTSSSSYDGALYYTSSGGGHYGILVYKGSTVKAIATKNGYSNSSVASLTLPSSNSPVSTPPTITNYGTYYPNSNYYVVGISCSTSDVGIYYTDDGSTPTISSYRYSLNSGSYRTSSGDFYSGILVYKGSTVKAIATKSGYTYSSVATLTLPSSASSGTVSTPTITNRGTWESDSSYSVVSISETSGLSYYYTTDGNTPTTSSSNYDHNADYYKTSGGSSYYGILVHKGSTVKAIATLIGCTNSSVATLTLPGGTGYASSVNLNGQWRAVTTSCPSYNSSQYTVYESYSNYNVHSSTARMSITISGYDTFTIRIASSAESNFDYTIAYEIDSTSSVKVFTAGAQNTWKDVTYSNLGGGTHTITIEYRKDESYSYGNDRGYVCIPK